MAQALASPGLFSDDDVAVSPVFESTATGFGADVRKDLLSEFSAISPNLEGSQQVRLELICHKQSSVLPYDCSVTAKRCCDAGPTQTLQKRLEQNVALGEQLLLTAVYYEGRSNCILTQCLVVWHLV